ncbi:CBS domain-containing protein [Aggregatilineales bacterium SYSU G02658]
MVGQALVKDWMSKNVLTVDPKTPIAEAYRLMKERKVRRLPVVKDGRLLGIVTLGDVREASPSIATSLSVWEINYLWAQLTVDRVMKTDVIKLSPDATVLEAARLMLEHKISGLPVLENGKIVGIITESDIFRMLVTTEQAKA